SANLYPTTPVGSDDPITMFSQNGSALRGALLAGRYSTLATADESSSINLLAGNARDHSLLPHPTSDASSSSGNLVLKDQVAIYWKNLNNVTGYLAQHSGTIVRHFRLATLHSGGQYLTEEGHRIYCNHGTCPTSPKMTLSNHTYWRSGWRSRH